MDVDHAGFRLPGLRHGHELGRRLARRTRRHRQHRPVKAQGDVTSSVFTAQPLRRLHPRGAGHALGEQHLRRQRGVRVRPARLQQRLPRQANTARGNGKHGFIFSRGCDAQRAARQLRLRQRRPRLHDRRRSVGPTTASAESRIDASNDNVVTGNIAYDNADSGVEIEGGTGNVVSANNADAQRHRHPHQGRCRGHASATTRSSTATDTASTSSTAAGRIPVTGNRISGSWAAINLATTSSATLGVNTPRTSPRRWSSRRAATRDTTWIGPSRRQYIRWNPLLVLWGLILGVPIVVARDPLSCGNAAVPAETPRGDGS